MKQVQTAGATLVAPGTPISLRQARAIAASIARDTSANPAPLGLLGFGITTLLVNLEHVAVVAPGSPALAVGVASGGVAQLVAGVMEHRKRNTFGTVAFAGYGLFWLSLAALLLGPRVGLVDPDRSGMAAYLLVWGLFTVLMSIATLRMSRAVMAVFFSLTIFFFLLAFADATGSALLERVAGVEGIACGLGAVYAGAAQVVNEVWGRTVLPLGALDDVRGGRRS
jgi:succinate-acetate transporter protein